MFFLEERGVFLFLLVARLDLVLELAVDVLELGLFLFEVAPPQVDLGEFRFQLLLLLLVAPLQL